MRPFLFAILVCCSYCVPAQAALYNITYTGTVTQGTDGNGLFGAVDLSDQAYVGMSIVLSYLVDSSLGTKETSPLGFQLQGFGANSPIVASWTTINGQTYTMNAIPNVGSVIVNNAASGSALVPRYRQDSFFTDDTLIFVHETDTIITADYIPSLASPPQQVDDIPLLDSTFPGAFGDNSFSYISIDRTDPEHPIVTYTTIFSRFDSITVTTAVPEPSTWAMLIVGFAGVGFAAYRKRRFTRLLPA